MKHAPERKESSHVSEMTIVDTFTRLIFGEANQFSELEHSIIRTLRAVDGNVALDSLAEMGGYLRALEVAEMIDLVARVQHCLAEGVPMMVNPAAEKTAGVRPRC